MGLYLDIAKAFDEILMAKLFTGTYYDWLVSYLTSERQPRVTYKRIRNTEVSIVTGAPHGSYRRIRVLRPI